MSVPKSADKAAFALALIMAFGSRLSAQITIEWTEIPHAIGTRWVKNIAYGATVSLGTTGGPQTWTFTTQPMGPDSCTNVVFPISQTPFHDSFPNANLVYASIEGVDSAFLYMQLEPGYLSTLGLVGTVSSGEFIRYIPPDTNDLPEHYNDSRHYYTSHTVTLGPGNYMLYQKRGFEHINAYGTVVIPYGSFPCLRYVLYDTLVQIVYYNNIPVYYDTMTRILHQFVAENRSGVVCVNSNEGETNPYFTNAAVLERLTYFATGVEELRNPAADGRMVMVYPNPFKEGVTFAYTGKSVSPMTLEIYDAQGRLVWAFATRSSEAVITWTGNDAKGVSVPDGVYFYRIHSADEQITGKFSRTR